MLEKMMTMTMTTTMTITMTMMTMTMTMMMMMMKITKKTNETKERLRCRLLLFNTEQQVNVLSDNARFTGICWESSWMDDIEIDWRRKEDAREKLSVKNVLKMKKKNRRKKEKKLQFFAQILK